MQQIASIIKQLESGIFPDRPSRAAPLWLEGSNIYFEDGGISNGLGQYLLFNATEVSEVLGIASLEIAGTPTLFYATADKLWKWTEAGGLVDVSRLSGGAYNSGDNLWSIEPWGEWVLATNGVDTPQLYKSGNFADLTGLGSITKAEIVSERNPFGFLFNTNLSSHHVAWSDDDDIETWVASASNQAGDLYPRGLNSEIKACRVLGSELAIYSSDEMRIVSYIGSPNIFGIQQAVKGIGAVSKEAVVNIGSIHIGFGQRGIWQTDGVSKQYLDKGIIHDYIYNNLNRSKLHKIIGWHDSKQNTVAFYYPSADSAINNRGVGYNYKNSTWTIFNYGRSFALDNSVFDFGITGDSNGNIFAQSVTGGAPTNQSDGNLTLENFGVVYNSYGKLGYGELGYGGDYYATD